MDQPFNRTWTYIKRLNEYFTYGVIAKRCGKEKVTAEAWGREPESNTNPTGSGKNNPLDCVIRLIGIAHKEDAGLAREMAEIFTGYVDYLDGKKGETTKDSIHELVGKSAQEHLDIVLAILKSESPDWNKVIAECMQSNAATNHIVGYAKTQINNDTISWAKNEVEQRSAGTIG